MRKIILITGASSGIGKVCAEYLCAQGNVVYGACRTLLESPPPFNQLKMDVNNSASFVVAVQRVLDSEGKIDVLVNNAGFGVAGAIEEHAESEIRRQMETNFFAPLRLCQTVIPHMRKAGGGLIVNIGSLGGLMGLPFQGIYSASKFALTGVTESLRTELAPFNIKVSMISPGDFATRFTANRHIVSGSGANSPYRARFAEALKQIEMDENSGENPIVVAQLLERIIRMKAPKACYLAGKREQTIFASLKGIIPSRFFHSLIADHYRQN